MDNLLVNPQMAPSVNLNDKRAWDDSLLINSWNDALKEYKKYHSIHKSGKRLEDVLTEEELKELRDDYGDVMEEAKTVEEAETETNGVADHEDTDAEPNGVAYSDQSRTPQQEPEYSEQPQQTQLPSPEAPAPQAAGALADAMPQAILGTVQDDDMKNIMMSWYYAGYYTGLHAGRQQAAKAASPKK
ncbi:hypothetical protein BDW02DRAFT_533275 [Decorospora gaudefroyi]|uniref:Survival Motor Neuron Gemin2-binding domain-containing protein n=1 Tax=Decorospora gaudefroyi TaxID=184978 RepID=A0A6A5K404_9PLEO|nr:hypothetical protein BDW02DRAFT_533275 [Decorospora gaudefroyi]